MEYYNQAVEFLKEKGILIHSEEKPSFTGHSCPGSAMQDFRETAVPEKEETESSVHRQSKLRQWPIQLMLVPATAPYFQDADLIITADCVPFAYADFHDKFLRGSIVLVGCPKLDDAEFYKNKLASIFKDNSIKSVTCLHMEVPCCFGLVKIVQTALEESGKVIPFSDIEISIKGEIKNNAVAINDK